MRTNFYTPRLYHLLQSAFGSFQARVTTLREYAPLQAGDRVLDIGCGPGHIVNHLPSGIEYHGFDIDEPSIRYAQGHFAAKGKFYCTAFTDDVASTFNGVRAVIMNGVLHHLSDEEADAVLVSIKRCLRPDGYVFTLDGCLHPGQRGLHRWLHEHDKGKFVRDEAGYRAILTRAFPIVDTHIREDLCRLPHTLAINVSRSR